MKEQGLSLNEEGYNGETPAIDAAEACVSNGEALRIIMRYGADPDIPDRDGNDAYDMAVRKGQTKCSQIVHPCNDARPLNTWIWDIQDKQGLFN